MLDTNRSYCERLAQVAFYQIAHEAQLNPRPAGCVADQAAPGTLRERMILFFAPQRTDPDVYLASAAALAAALELRPDVQSKLTPLTEYTVSKWLLERELESSGYWAGDKPLRDGQLPDAYECARVRGASGLCFSGGGIRSATFSLGVAQGLSRLGVLGRLDYLSSVSGGGYMHQFLANWICRTGSVESVEELLDPIPRNTGTREPTNHARASVQPEPLRWLRRYSNYLAPRKGLLTLDTWTIGATWIRNTGLNLIILLSSLYCVLLLPHLGAIPYTHLLAHTTLLHWAVAGSILYSVYLLRMLWNCMETLKKEDPEDATRGEKPKKTESAVRMQVRTHSFVLTSISLLVAAVLVAPFVYRSVIPGNTLEEPATAAHATFDSLPPSAAVHYTGAFESDQAGKESVRVSVDTRSAQPDSALRQHWKARPYPLWNLLVDGRGWHHPWVPLLLHGRFITGHGLPIACFGLYCAGALLLILRLSKIRRWLYGVFVVVGIVSAYFLLDGIRLLFFVLCFLVPYKLISAMAVAVLPVLLFSVPFLLMEEMVGLLGHLTTSGQREWLARWRALSLLVGVSWLAITVFSLFGAWAFSELAGYAKTSFAVWGAWLGTTLAGVLSARSIRSSQAQEGGGGSSKLLGVVAAIAPPLFVAGLLILLSAFVSWSLVVPCPDGALAPCLTQPPPHQELHRALFLFGFSLALSALFGWRVDINDFSMHSFYRDRIARCYAGAVNAMRRPNPFTGMAREDRQLAVYQLLPRRWFSLDPEHPGEGTYAGPYPVFCTSINLTTGEDLAYQERKAASFAFTPLFSGYSVGWTAARTAVNQLNGFVDTRTYVYFKDHEDSEIAGPDPEPRSGDPLIYADPDSISVATASAISGAAASPNMGYHSNAAAAFLLTVFNVRLGWWLRNPRRRAIDGCSPYASPSAVATTGIKRAVSRVVRRISPGSQPLEEAAMPSSPRVGFFSLIKELFGHSDDTTPYIYLTDGGHFDNMGLYELLRRRCRTIVVCDAEADPQLHFEGIGMAIRKARLDFGVEVTLDRVQWTDPDSPAPPVSPVKNADGTDAPKSHDSGHPTEAALAERNTKLPYVISAHFSQREPTTLTGTLSRQAPPPVIEGLSSFGEFPSNSIHCVHGTIRYPEDAHEDQFGHILYLKASMTGDEPPDILNYRMQHADFPHDSTLNQFFTESQFESYRRLGEHIVLEDKVVLSWLKQYFSPKVHTT